ncbi:MAG: hypothetical protein AB8B78_14855 [Polaribacter sp.]
MKKILFLSILVLGCKTVFSQSTKKKTGPKAKNAKIWEQKKPSTILIVNSFEKEDLTAPELKNQKIWEKEKSKSKIIVQTKARKQLFGPKAKNRKPWEK